MFAAVPAGLALELGRRILRSMYKNIYTYNLKEGQYEKAFVLNSTIADKKNDTNIAYDYVNNKNIICIPILGKIACGDFRKLYKKTRNTFLFPKQFLVQESFLY